MRSPASTLRRGPDNILTAMALAPPTAQANKALWPFYLVFVVFTGFCGLCLLGEIYTTYTRYHQGITAVGTVQAVRNESNTDGKWTAYDVTFKSHDGQAHTINNHYSKADNPALYQVGQEIRVIYLPEDADDGRIDSAREKYWVVIGLSFMFLTGLGILAFIFLNTRRAAAASRVVGVAEEGH